MSGRIDETVERHVGGRPKTVITPDLMDLVVNLYNQRVSKSEIARRLNMTRYLVNRTLDDVRKEDSMQSAQSSAT